jgi:hypothetical protein
LWKRLLYAFAYLFDGGNTGAKIDTYAPSTVNAAGSNSPSDPKILAFLPCSRICRANCWAFAATCHASTTTCVFDGTLVTSAEKSVCDRGTDLRVTLLAPFARRLAPMASASGAPYEVWSSMTTTRVALSFFLVKLAIVGDWIASFGTSRENPA